MLFKCFVDFLFTRYYTHEINQLSAGAILNDIFDPMTFNAMYISLLAGV